MYVVPQKQDRARAAESAHRQRQDGDALPLRARANGTLDLVPALDETDERYTARRSHERA